MHFDWDLTKILLNLYQFHINMTLRVTWEHFSPRIGYWDQILSELTRTKSSESLLSLTINCHILSNRYSENILRIFKEHSLDIQRTSSKNLEDTFWMFRDPLLGCSLIYAACLFLRFWKLRESRFQTRRGGFHLRKTRQSWEVPYRYLYIATAEEWNRRMNRVWNEKFAYWGTFKLIQAVLINFPVCVEFLSRSDLIQSLC